MARIFVSYSRADRQFVDEFVPLLRRVYGNDSVWFDDDIHGGSDWWQMILDEIADCELFVYLSSNDSLGSPYCQAEFREALRLHKQILPVIVRPKTLYPGAVEDDLKVILKKTQYVDMSRGFKDHTAISQLYGAVHKLLEDAYRVQPRPPLSAQPVAQPAVPDKKPTRGRRNIWVIGITVALLTTIGLLIIVNGMLDNGDGNQNQPTKLPTSLADADSTESAESSGTETPTATETPSPTDIPTATDTGTPTDTPTATDTPIPIETQVWLDVTASQEAANIFANATAAQWTYTPSHTPTETDTPTAIPNDTATYEAAFAAAAATMTAMMWTPTDTPTSTQTPTDTPSFTPTKTPTNTPKPTSTSTFTPTFTPTSIPAGSANRDWTPIISEFNGIPMAYVPEGCFMMGSEDRNDDEKPVHKVCLSEFWIGQTEITNAQYKACVDAGACEPPKELTYFDDPAYADHPVVYVDWDQANTYATWIGSSLPTEAQWEYAARGPEGWIYPWGNTVPTCKQANTRGCEEGMAPVGERPTGASWVGALDMSGNVWEWVADWYDNYSDEDLLDPTGPLSGNERVRRGGSWGDDVRYARCASRYRYFPYLRYNLIGFRVVHSAPK